MWTTLHENNNRLYVSETEGTTTTDHTYLLQEGNYTGQTLADMLATTLNSNKVLATNYQSEGVGSPNGLSFPCARLLGGCAAEKTVVVLSCRLARPRAAPPGPPPCRDPAATHPRPTRDPPATHPAERKTTTI